MVTVDLKVLPVRGRRRRTALACSHLAIDSLQDSAEPGTLQRPAGDPASTHRHAVESRQELVQRIPALARHRAHQRLRGRPGERSDPQENLKRVSLMNSEPMDFVAAAQAADRLPQVAALQSDGRLVRNAVALLRRRPARRLRPHRLRRGPPSQERRQQDLVGALLPYANGQADQCQCRTSGSSRLLFRTEGFDDRSSFVLFGFVFVAKTTVSSCCPDSTAIARSC